MKYYMSVGRKHDECGCFTSVEYEKFFFTSAFYLAFQKSSHKNNFTFSLSINTFSNWILLHEYVQEMHQMKNVKM